VEKENSKLKVSLGTILLSQAEPFDKFLLGIGISMSLVTGLGLPSFVFIFGDVINSFGNPDLDSNSDFIAPFRKLSIELTVIGVGIWITSYLYFTSCIILSERIGKKTKVAYLRSILKQDITWFDTINP
jgi:ATP-binding cassette subfamily B (MDR/TAP) protein 1